MKFLIAVLALAASVSMAAFDLLTLDPGAAATNEGPVSAQSYTVIGQPVAVTVYCNTNGTATVSSVVGYGTSRDAAKTIAGPFIFSAGQYTTNLAVATYLYGDRVKVTIAPVSYLVSTSRAAVVLSK